MSDIGDFLAYVAAVLSDGDILVRKGRPWFSWAILSGVAVMAFAAAGVYFNVRGGNEEVLRRLATNETAVSKVVEAVTSLADGQRAMQYDVNQALSDRWTGTDMRFLWSEVGRFWADFARLNPTMQIPPWPPAVRVSANDGRQGH